MKIKPLLLVVLALLVVTMPSPLTAQWSYTGELQIARSSHTATLLNNGKVLIAGGKNLREAELYDPGTGSFSLTGSTNKYFMQGSSATLLPDGRVLLAGGISGEKYAEIYDPATGLFTATDSLETNHSFHTANLLADGRVLIAAGKNYKENQSHAVAEIYDPASGTFSRTGSLLTDRSGHAAIQLADGRVLIAGGGQTTGPGTAITLLSCEIYDPVTGLFTATGKMNVYHSGFSLSPLPDGRILAVGAFSSTACDIFDPQTGLWSEAGAALNTRRRNMQTVALGNGRILFIGGLIPAITRSVGIYDPVSGTFAFADSTNAPRCDHSATLLQDGRILVAGGYTGSANVKTAELITPAALGVAAAEPTLPADYSLRQNYPNPFNSGTVVEYTLLRPGTVTVQVLDLSGKTIAILEQGFRQAGLHRMQWSGRDAAGRELPSGCYFLRLTAPGSLQSRKMLLLR